MQTPWYLNEDEYSWFLDHVGISKADYLSAIEKMISVFPIEESADYTDHLFQRKGSLSGPFTLHPVPFNVLACHPVFTFMSGKVKDYRALSEIVNLGKDLCATEAISGITSIQRDLRRFDQYIGRLFEVEVLAELVRADMSPEILGTPDFVGRLNATNVYIEARHRGVPFGSAVTQGITRGLAFKDFGELSIKLGNLGAVGETVNEITERILSSVMELLASNSRTMVADDFEICHRADSEVKRVSISYGAESYDADVANLVGRTLEDKAKQLLPVMDHEGLKILAMDLRSLFPTLPRDETRSAIAPGWLDYYEPRIEKWRSSAIEATHRFLEATRTTDIVLIWWKNNKGLWPAQINDQFRYRNTVQIVCCGGFEHICEARDLREGLIRVTAEELKKN